MQVGSVSVRGWDVKQKKVIVGRGVGGAGISMMGGKATGPTHGEQSIWQGQHGEREPTGAEQGRGRPDCVG